MILNNPQNNKMEVCVIMSLYKNDRLNNFKQAVNSILTQSFTEFDFHIQCDGVIEKSVEEYICNINDSRVTVFRREENKGFAYSLNELLGRVLKNKNYEYIFRMDSDDISITERLEKQMTFLNKNKDVDCVGTWAVEINAIGEEYFFKKMPVTHEECYDLFKKRDCLIHPTVAFRKSYFDKAGLYPENTYFGEDTMMWANGFASGCQFANIPEYLFKFRLDDNFFERRKGWKHAKSIFTLRCKVNKLLNFPFTSTLYAILYAVAKLMPKYILNLLYKVLR